GPPGAPRPAAIPAEHGPHEHPDNRPTQGVVEREPVAQPVRDGERPLPDGNPGQDRLDEIRGLLGHAPPAATGADRAAFARQRHEALERAVVAANPQEAMDEQSTPEQGAELAFDEAGQPRPVGAGGRRGEEGLQMLADYSVQNGVAASAWSVESHGARPSGLRAARQRLAAARVNKVLRTADAARRNTRCNGVLPRRSLLAAIHDDRRGRGTSPWHSPEPSGGAADKGEMLVELPRLPAALCRKGNSCCGGPSHSIPTTRGCAPCWPMSSGSAESATRRSRTP